MKDFKLKVEWLKPEDLTPYANNSKKHPESQIDKLAGNIAEFGFDQPIVVDQDKVIVKGHGRREAALRLGMKEVPVIFANHLDEYQIKAARIADNKLASLEYDVDKLKFEVGTLERAGFDMNLTGIEFGELSELLKADDISGGGGGTEGLTDPDEIPEKPPAKTKPGQLWKLGNHRLLCGDSTKMEEVNRLMGGKKADLFFSDPPYGDFVGGFAFKTKAEREKSGAGAMKRVTKILNDGSVSDFSQAFKNANAVLQEKATKMVFFKWNKWNQILDACDFWGEPSGVNVWVRSLHPPAAFFRFNPVHEFCFHWGNLEDKREPLALTNVWIAEKEKDSKEMHPTVKPIAILSPAINVTASKGEIVLDLFGGSGSTLIACEGNARRCFMMELDPHYCDVIIKRWEDFTGKSADLLEDSPDQDSNVQNPHQETKNKEKPSAPKKPAGKPAQLKGSKPSLAQPSSQKNKKKAKSSKK